MRIETIHYDSRGGWSPPAFPELDSDRTLVLVFGSAKEIEDNRPMEALFRAYPRARILGCSTAGEILGTTISDNSLAIAVCRFDHTPLRSTSLPIETAAESFSVGARIATELAGPGLRGLLVLSDGTNVNGSELVRGLNSVLPANVLTTGGLAGDGDRFQKTWVIDHGKLVSGRVSAVGLYGDHVVLGHGSKGGWDIFGPERLVTRSLGNILFEIDRQPALDLYKKYLGDLATGLPANALLFPLGIRRGSGEATRLVRTILAIDENAGSMTFAGDIPQGSLVQFMRANLDRLVDGAMEAAQLARGSQEHVGHSLAIAISCVGRRLVLTDRAEEEVEAVAEVLPENTHMIGFYSYGELSPYANGRCELHNQTMTLTTLSETE
jgi:hypothetical protein